MAVAGSLLRSPTRTANPYCCTNRTLNLVCSQHTAKWMQDSSKKSPMELINEIPPIKVEGRIVACEGDTSPAVGHPIEFICLDLKEPAVCNTAVFPFNINYLP